MRTKHIHELNIYIKPVRILQINHCARKFNFKDWDNEIPTTFFIFSKLNTIISY